MEKIIGSEKSVSCINHSFVPHVFAGVTTFKIHYAALKSRRKAEGVGKDPFLFISLFYYSRIAFMNSVVDSFRDSKEGCYGMILCRRHHCSCRHQHTIIRLTEKYRRRGYTGPIGEQRAAGQNHDGIVVFFSLSPLFLFRGWVVLFVCL